MDETRQIRVQHVKTQQSKTLVSDNVSEFEFSWTLTITIDYNLTDIQDIQVHLIKLNIHPSTSEERKQAITNIFEKPEILKLRKDASDKEDFADEE